jgi:antirestriction protein
MLVTDLTVDALDALLDDNGIDRDAFDVFIEDVAGTHYVWNCEDSMVDAFRDAYAGAGSLEDYAYDYASECLGLDGTALAYFDYAKYARDLELSGEMTESRGYRFNTAW